MTNKERAHAFDPFLSLVYVLFATGIDLLLHVNAVEIRFSHDTSSIGMNK